MSRLLALTCALLLACSPAALADSGGPGVRTGGSVAASPKAGGTRYGVGTSAERAAARAKRQAAVKRARERAARARERAAEVRRRREAARGDGVFPVRGGDWSYGDRFGVPRPGGRTHMGQDIPAPEGTPLVSPRAGRVSSRGFQAGGAGNYLVVRDAARDMSYVFMHLVSGSQRVGEGDRVGRGEQIGRVGSTGDATGPHLHFEVWIGPWQAGGRAVDPLPYLRRWQGR